MIRIKQILSQKSRTTVNVHHQKLYLDGLLQSTQDKASALDDNAVLRKQVDWPIPSNPFREVMRVPSFQNFKVHLLLLLMNKAKMSTQLSKIT